MKKGFTLIELLAVIVVLAIIAVIAVPTITGIIDKTKQNAAKSSTLGFVDAIEKQVALSELKDTQYVDREYTYDEIDAKVKGQGPTAGRYELLKGRVVNAIFCINGYTTTYNGEDATVGNKCNSEDMKYASTLKTSKTVVSLTYPNNETIEVIENTSGGTLSCESSDSSVATCEINENSLVIKPGKKEGTSTITLTSASTSKYKEAYVAIVASTEEGLLSVTALDYNGTYDGNAHGITVSAPDATVKYGETAGTYNLDQSPTYTDAGTYTVYYQVTKEGYKAVTGSKTVTINKAQGSVQLEQSSGNVTYNEQKEINITKSTGEISASVLDSSIASATIVDNKLVVRGLKVGSTTITLTSKATNNYTSATTTYEVNVVKANNTLTLSSNTGSVTYPDSTTFEVTTNTSGGTLSCESSNTSAVTCSISGNTVTVTPGTSAASNISITVKSAATNNYNEASATYVVTNNLGTLSVTANGYTGTFDGNAHGITVTSSGATIKYGTASGTYNLTSSPTYINPGTYTVYYQVKKTGYKTVTGSKNVVINALTASGVTYTKNGQTTVQTALDDLFTKFN